MFGVSGEHLLILGIILLIFGPRRLPEVGTKVGKAMKNFKDAYAGIEDAKFRRLGDLPSGGENRKARAEQSDIEPADKA